MIVRAGRVAAEQAEFPLDLSLVHLRTEAKVVVTYLTADSVAGEPPCRAPARERSRPRSWEWFDCAMGSDESDEPPRTYVGEARGAFGANVSDQVAHLENESAELAAYVGRRLDQSWRWLDYRVTRWLGDSYQETVDFDASIEDIHEVMSLKASLPPIDVALSGGLARVALKHLIAADTMVSEIDLDDARRTSLRMHLARRSFAAYRLAKYRWLEVEFETGRYQLAAYRWLET